MNTLFLIINIFIHLNKSKKLFLNKKYVKFPIAQGLETFNAGLNTTAIESTLTSIKTLWNRHSGNWGRGMEGDGFL